MDTESTIPICSTTHCDANVQSNTEEVEGIGNKSEVVNSTNTDRCKRIAEDQLCHLTDELSDVEHQEIAALAFDRLEPLDCSRDILYTLVRQILYLQLLLISVGRRDLAILTTDFAQAHSLVHLREVTKGVLTVVVFEDISNEMKQKLMTIVRRWIPEFRIVVTKWECHTWLRKMVMMKRCQRCLQIMGCVNPILQGYIRQRNISLIRKVNQNSEISIEMCSTGCDKCSATDHELLRLRHALREALNEYNTLKSHIKRSKVKHLPHVSSRCS